MRKKVYFWNIIPNSPFNFSAGNGHKTNEMFRKWLLKINCLCNFFFFFFALTLFSVNQRQNNFTVRGFLHNVNKKEDRRADFSNAVGIQLWLINKNVQLLAFRMVWWHVPWIGCDYWQTQISRKSTVTTHKF